MQEIRVNTAINEGQKSSLTDEQIGNSIHFFDAVQDVVDRLVREGGYRVIGGKLYPPKRAKNKKDAN